MCTRKPQEEPLIFAARCDGLAHEYLSQCNPEQALHSSQIFALILLHNAKLPTQTVDNISLQLHTDAKERIELDENIVCIPRSEIQSFCATVIDAGNVVATATTDGIVAHINDIAAKAQHIQNDHLQPTHADDAHRSIYLEDAVAAVSKLNSTDTGITRNADAYQGSSLITKRHSCMTGPSSYRRAKHNTSPLTIDARKRTTRCTARGELGHWYADKECPRNETHPVTSTKRSTKKSNPRSSGSRQVYNFTQHTQYGKKRSHEYRADADDSGAGQWRTFFRG